MMNKTQKFEWRVPAYMGIWTLVAAAVKWAIAGMHGTSAQSIIGSSAVGVICMTFGVILSYVEKNSDTPFLWWKKAPTKHWAMPGLGVFSNSASIAAIGIGFMATSVAQIIILFAATAAVMILQRRFVEGERAKAGNKVKRFLVGLAVPTIVIALVSVKFFYSNVLAANIFG